MIDTFTWSQFGLLVFLCAVAFLGGCATGYLRELEREDKEDDR